VKSTALGCACVFAGGATAAGSAGGGVDETGAGAGIQVGCAPTRPATGPGATGEARAAAPGQEAEGGGAALALRLLEIMRSKRTAPPMKAITRASADTTFIDSGSIAGNWASSGAEMRA
jgi:hypothetical protein